MTVDSGNVRPDVYAPTVEFTLAANVGRDLQAAADADHDAFLAAKAQRLHFVSRHYEDLATTPEARDGVYIAGRCQVVKHPLRGRHEQPTLRTIGYRKIRSGCARIFSAGRHGRL
jgi:hypothetical protein